MKLSDFFQDKLLKKDADVLLTHYADQPIDGIACFCLTENFV